MLKIRIGRPKTGFTQRMANAQLPPPLYPSLAQRREMEHHRSKIPYRVGAQPGRSAVPLADCGAARPSGFAKYAYGQNIDPEGPSSAAACSIYRLPPGIVTASRFSAPSRRERKRRVKEVAEALPRIRARCFMNARDGAVKDAAFHSANPSKALHILLNQSGEACISLRETAIRKRRQRRKRGE